MDIRSLVENELVQDQGRVWKLKNHSEFGYTDGTASEKYLRNVFARVTDLGSRSVELDRYIKDWPSEYHLSRKRAQLLSGFDFDPNLRVLEVGCGCGAITRYLGETFNYVISVEGSLNRAHLARQRTRELGSVAILCGPFQEIRFREKFDLIVCIGVLEYSAAFIAGDDPYDAAIKYFSGMLTARGAVVIAIENQFGLKYFNGAREDHLGARFQGIEGYHRKPGVARTFGKSELESRLRKYFERVDFYYPYPDYKIPDCVVSSEFLGSTRAGELVSQMRSRDYSGPERSLWNEPAVALELNRNGALDFFANSFLVIAGHGDFSGVAFKQLGILFSSGRTATYCTETKILTSGPGEVTTEKRKMYGHLCSESRSISLMEGSSIWVDGLSVLTLVTLRALSTRRQLSDIFQPCKKWIELLQAESRLEGGVRWLEGVHVDSLWGNAYDAGVRCVLIDREWVWHEDIRMNVVVIRAIYDFLSRLETIAWSTKALSQQSGRSLIKQIAAVLGVRLSREDFAEFVRIESEISHVVCGLSKSRQVFYLHWFFRHRASRQFFRRALPAVKHLLRRLEARLSIA